MSSGFSGPPKLMNRTAGIGVGIGEVDLFIKKLLADTDSDTGRFIFAKAHEPFPPKQRHGRPAFAAVLRAPN